MLQTNGIASDLSSKGKCRQIGYMDKSIPEVRFAPGVSRNLVLVSVPALAEAFFTGADNFLIGLFADPKKAPIAEERFKQLVQAIPVKK